jgi:hypothetical protein
MAEAVKFFCGCFEFKVLKVELDPQHAGDLIVHQGPDFKSPNI